MSYNCHTKIKMSYTKTFVNSPLAGCCHTSLSCLKYTFLIGTLQSKEHFKNFKKNVQNSFKKNMKSIIILLKAQT